MPALVARSTMTTSTSTEPSAGIDVARKSTYSIDHRRSAPFDFDTYLLSASPPGFEFTAARYRQYSPVTSWSASSLVPELASSQTTERYRRRFFDSSATSKDVAKVTESSQERVGSFGSTSSAINSLRTNGSIPPSLETKHPLTDNGDVTVSHNTCSSLTQSPSQDGCSRCTCCGALGGVRKTRSMPSNGVQRRKVSFADDVGKLLEYVRIFAESPDTPPTISRDVIERHEKLAESDSACRLKLVPNFVMPRDNRAALVDRVNRNLVSLDSVRVVTDDKSSTAMTSQQRTDGSFDSRRPEVPIGHRLIGTVVVKNVAFEKSVIVRCTFDDWLTSRDVTATFARSEYMAAADRRAYCFGAGLNSAAACFDVFQFQVDVPASSNDWLTSKLTAQLAVCFEFPGVECEQRHWDNNDGSNYSLQLLLLEEIEDATKQRTATKNRRVAASGSSTDNINNGYSADLSSPYW